MTPKPALSDLFRQLTQAEKYLHECQRKLSRLRAKFVPATDWHSDQENTFNAKPRLVHPTDVDRLNDLAFDVEEAKLARDAIQTRLCREFSKLPPEAIKRHAESPYYLQRRIAKHCLTLSAVTTNVPIHIREALEHAGLDPSDICKQALLKAYLDTDHDRGQTDPT
jgi:hypothetical protein